MKLLKYAASMALCNAVRLARFFPNNDPIMAFMLPFSKQEKWFHSAAFVFLTMIVFDYFTSGIGLWTLVTATAYSGLGIIAYFYLARRKKVSLKNYLGAGIVSVLVFDFVTGVLLGPALFGMPLWQAFLGQIPFTALHLLSASAYIFFLTPFLDRHVIGATAFEDENAFLRAKSFLKTRVFAKPH